MFSITSRLDTDEVALCKSELNVDTKSPEISTMEMFCSTFHVVIWTNSLIFVLVRRESPGLYQGPFFLLAPILLWLFVLSREEWTTCGHMSSTHPDSQILRGQLFFSVPVCCWGSSVHAVIELVFPRMIVWCSGKSSATEEEGVPKVNI